MIRGALGAENLHRSGGGLWELKTPIGRGGELKTPGPWAMGATEA